MPEPDTFDLDAAFEALEHDIAGLSRGPGAARAVSTARRRRRTSIGAAAAVALVALGGIVATQVVGTHDTTVEPVGRPSPAPFDNAALTKATKGWTGPWGDLTTPKSGALHKKTLDPHCLAKLPSAVAPGSTGSGGGIAVTPRVHEMTRSWLMLWGDDHPNAARQTYAALVPLFQACHQATPRHSYTWVDAQAQSWDVSDSQQLWVAQADDAVAIMWMGGSAGAVPDRIDRRVADALVAGLQSPASFPGHVAPGGASGSASPAG